RSGSTPRRRRHPACRRRSSTTRARRRGGGRRTSRHSRPSCSNGWKRVCKTNDGWPMAKGQVTADDLASGMKSFGGLSSLGGAARPPRDPRFADPRPNPPPPAVAVVPERAAEALRREGVTGHDTSKAGEGTKPLATPKPPRERKPVTPRTATRIEPATP